MKQTLFLIIILSCLFARQGVARESMLADFHSELFYEIPQSVSESYLEDIDSYIRDAEGIMHAYRKEHFFWNEDPVTLKKRLEARVMEDAYGNLISCHAYEYDKNGLLIKIIINGSPGVENKEEHHSPLLQIVIDNCKSGPSAGLPETIEEFKFDDESNEFFLVARASNHYDEHGRLSRQQFIETSSGQTHERIFAYDALGRLSRVEDSLDKCEEIVYDHRGNRVLIERTHQGRLAGIRRHTYDEDNRLLEIEEIDANTNLRVKIFKYHALSDVKKHFNDVVENPLVDNDPQTFDNIHRDIKDLPRIDEIPRSINEDQVMQVPDKVPSSTTARMWNAVCSAGKACSSAVSEGVNKLRNLKDSLSYGNHIRKEYDDALHGVFGKNFLKLNGYYQHDAESGCFGASEELNAKVRITLINGILNVREDLHLNLNLLANTHGGTPIHYVFRPTEGWASDLVNSFMVKCGYVSRQARLLADKWKELIQEMGGVNGGGCIFHYAHSIGGTDTYAAKDLLTPDEQKLIHVITIGSPTMIPDEGFASVTNYVSKRDGVCLLDPAGYVRGWTKKDCNVFFLGSFWGIPFIEHTLEAESYDTIIKTLGERFLNKYSE